MINRNQYGRSSTSYQKFPGGPIKFQEISRRVFKYQYISRISRSCRHPVPDPKIDVWRKKKTASSCMITPSAGLQSWRATNIDSGRRLIFVNCTIWSWVDWLYSTPDVEVNQRIWCWPNGRRQLTIAGLTQSQSVTAAATLNGDCSVNLTHVPDRQREQPSCSCPLPIGYSCGDADAVWVSDTNFQRNSLWQCLHVSNSKFQTFVGPREWLACSAPSIYGRENPMPGTAKSHRNEAPDLDSVCSQRCSREGPADVLYEYGPLGRSTRLSTRHRWHTKKSPKLDFTWSRLTKVSTVTDYCQGWGK